MVFSLQISNNFVEWLNTIGGNDKNTITASAINKMFQVGFRTHAATSLCVRIKEMPSVPDEVAKARFVKAVRRKRYFYPLNLLINIFPFFFSIIIFRIQTEKLYTGN